MMRENDRLKHLLKAKEEQSINKNLILPQSDGYAIQDKLLSISKTLGSSGTNRSCHHYQIHSELVLIVDQLIGKFKYLQHPNNSTIRRSLSTDSRTNTKSNLNRPRSLSLTTSKTIKPIPNSKPNTGKKYVPLKSEPIKKGIQASKRQRSNLRI